MYADSQALRAKLYGFAVGIILPDRKFHCQNLSLRNRDSEKFEVAMWDIA